jgi:hypothetical protein
MSKSDEQSDDKAQQALAKMRDANSRVREGRVGPQYDAGVRDGRASRDHEVEELRIRIAELEERLDAADAELEQHR